MSPVVLAAIALLPAVPGVVQLLRALRARTRKWASSIMVCGALTIAAGVAVYAVSFFSLFPAVGRAPPEQKAGILEEGLNRSSPALTAGLVVGAALCAAGGVTRSLFKEKQS
jgi:hypothetical protein